MAVDRMCCFQPHASSGHSSLYSSQLVLFLIFLSLTSYSDLYSTQDFKRSSTEQAFVCISFASLVFFLRDSIIHGVPRQQGINPG